MAAEGRLSSNPAARQYGPLGYIPIRMKLEQRFSEYHEHLLGYKK